MSNKKLDVLALKTIRKASHLTNKSIKKGAHFLDRVERKATNIIIDKTGSPDERSNVSIDDIIYGEFPHMTPVFPTLPRINQRPSVTIFAFLDPRGFYGGIATLLYVGAMLANELGYDLRVAQTTGYSDKTDVLEFLAKQGIVIEPSRYSTINLSNRSMHDYGYLSLHPDDVVLVSAWWDAHVAAQLPLQRKFVYLIQDYEPIFYNNSDQRLFADQTYLTEKFIPIVNTPILLEYFKANGYDYIAKNAVAFHPAPSPNVQSIGKQKDSNKKTLFLYGRPQVHRNLFFSALRAVDTALASPELSKYTWEVYAAGSDSIPDIKLKSGHVIKNRGKMSLKDYYKFAQSIDVAVSPMLAPHPNYPTLEFASLGVPVVTTKWETKQDLREYSKNIFLTDPDSESMAKAIIAACTTPKEKLRQQHKSSSITGDWKKTLQAPIKQVAKALQKRTKN